MCVSIFLVGLLCLAPDQANLVVFETGLLQGGHSFFGLVVVFKNSDKGSLIFHSHLLLPSK
jgi:hypothetical protein